MLREQSYPFGERGFTVLGEDEKPALLEGLVRKKETRAFLDSVRKAKQGLVLPPGEYQDRLTAARLLDYDDLLLYACRLLDERPEALRLCRERARHLLIDEFQDTSSAQYALARRLAGEDVWAIGDPDQRIYGFSVDGFDPFDAFRRDFPGCATLRLSENYRSQAVIVEAAKDVIAANPAQRELRSRLEAGLPVEIAAFDTDRQEAEMVARGIEGLLGGSSAYAIDTLWARKESESYVYGLKDIAVLYRTHAQARLLSGVFERSGLPFKVFGKPSSAQDIEDCQEPVPEGEYISLMTLHRAKGLEFPVVFITGCEDGLLPYAGCPIEEERRLFYVGMTRSRNRLFLSYCGKRLLYGRTLRHGPSPFVKDIQEELTRLRDTEPPPRRRPDPERSQPSLFDP
jgi:DNA helicase-2/ATP-dependent DNA helicase PcrA